MSRLGIVTFTSDFGWGGGYVAACEAIMFRVAPGIRVFHVWHEVPPGDVAAGGLALHRVVPLFPPAVHLAVVDPGVGTARRPLALLTPRGDALVGPDNGLLLAAAECLGGVEAVLALDTALVRAQAGLTLGEVSATFHGRDLFAPAAALLASGADPSSLGSPAVPPDLVRLPPPLAQADEGSALAEVIEVDRFGNVSLALPFELLPPDVSGFVVEVVGEGLPEWGARVVRTYGDLLPGELGVFADSWGQVALALNGASAAELLTVERGMSVRLTKPPTHARTASGAGAEPHT